MKKRVVAVEVNATENPGWKVDMDVVKAFWESVRWLNGAFGERCEVGKGEVGSRGMHGSGMYRGRVRKGGGGHQFDGAAVEARGGRAEAEAEDVVAEPAMVHLVQQRKSHIVLIITKRLQIGRAHV